MRKIPMIFCAGLLMTLSIYSCKKSPVVSVNNNGATTTNPVHKMTEISGEVSVSNYGFLTFPDEHAANGFTIYLKTHSLQDIKLYYEQINFVCSNPSVFNGNLNALPTEEQISDLMMSANDMLEIGTTVFRVSHDRLYLLTISGAMLNDETFQLMQHDDALPSAMNTFALDQERDPEFNLLAYVEANPAGTVEQSSGIPASALGKFWGSETTYGGCDPILGKPKYEVTYRFWFKRVHFIGYQSCDI